MSPRGVDALMPLDVAASSRTPLKADKEVVMVARVVGDQHYAGRLPLALLACCWKAGFQKFSGKCCWQAAKPRLGALASRAKASENPTFTGRAVRPLALALEAQGIGDADPGSAKGCRVGLGVAALEDQQREPFLVLEEEPVEGTEQRRETVGAELLRLGHGQQLDEETRATG